MNKDLPRDRMNEGWSFNFITAEWLWGIQGSRWQVQSKQEEGGITLQSSLLLGIMVAKPLLGG